MALPERVAQKKRAERVAVDAFSAPERPGIDYWIGVPDAGLPASGMIAASDDVCS